MNWRPLNWKEIIKDYRDPSSTYYSSYDFEAGADAMLEALPRLKVGNPYDTLVVDVLVSAMIEHNVKTGYLVFIPDEDK